MRECTPRRGLSHHLPMTFVNRKDPIMHKAEDTTLPSHSARSNFSDVSPERMPSLVKSR
jgi:hypothetical protein